MDTSDRLFTWIEELGKKAIQERDIDGLSKLLEQNRQMLLRLCSDAASTGDRNLVAKFRPWNIRTSLSVIETAARHGHVELCQLYSTMQHRIDIMAIVAARWGHTKIVEMMLDKGTEQQDRILRVACETGRVDVVKLLIDRGYNNRALIALLGERHGHIEIIALSLAK